MFRCLVEVTILLLLLRILHYVSWYNRVRWNQDGYGQIVIILRVWLLIIVGLAFWNNIKLFGINKDIKSILIRFLVLCSDAKRGRISFFERLLFLVIVIFWFQIVLFYFTLPINLFRHNFHVSVYLWRLDKAFVVLLLRQSPLIIASRQICILQNRWYIYVLIFIIYISVFYNLHFWRPLVLQFNRIDYMLCRGDGYHVWGGLLKQRRHGIIEHHLFPCHASGCYRLDFNLLVLIIGGFLLWLGLGLDFWRLDPLHTINNHTNIYQSGRSRIFNEILWFNQFWFLFIVPKW